MKKDKAPAMGEAAEAATEETTNHEAVIQSIEEKISYFQRKQELITRLRSLEDSQQGINTHLEALRKESSEDIFNSDNYKLTLSVKSGYNNEREIMKFRTSPVIADLLVFMLNRIAVNIEKLSSEIAE
jgi:hypothetical protein